MELRRDDSAEIPRWMWITVYNKKELTKEWKARGYSLPSPKQCTLCGQRLSGKSAFLALGPEGAAHAYHDACGKRVQSYYAEGGEKKVIPRYFNEKCSEPNCGRTIHIGEEAFAYRDTGMIGAIPEWKYRCRWCHSRLKGEWAGEAIGILMVVSVLALIIVAIIMSEYNRKEGYRGGDDLRQIQQDAYDMHNERIWRD